MIPALPPSIGDTWTTDHPDRSDAIGVKGICVNDEQKQMVLNPTECHHAIAVAANWDHGELIMQLSLRGVTHCFPSRKPMREEHDNSNQAHRINLTESKVEWDPQCTDFAQSKESMIDTCRRICEQPKKPNCDRIVAAITHKEGDAVPECNLGRALLANCNVSVMHTDGKRKGIDVLALSRQWGIGIQTTKRTLQATTQGAMQHFTGDRLSWCHWTNGQNLHCRRLAAATFSNALRLNASLGST